MFWVVRPRIEYHLFVSKFTFEHIGVQQVKNLFAVNLQVRNVDCDLTIWLGFFQMLYHFKQVASRPLNYAQLIIFNCLLNLWHELALLILHVVVAFHSIGLSGASLPIRKNSAMVTVYHFLNHIRNLCALIYVFLLVLTITDQIKLKVF